MVVNGGAVESLPRYKSFWSSGWQLLIVSINSESPLEILAKMVVNGGTVEANKGRAPSLASRQSVVAARPLKRGGSAREIHDCPLRMEHRLNWPEFLMRECTPLKLDSSFSAGVLDFIIPALCN